MDLSLKDAITIIDAVKKLDWYSIWLWLSLAIPLYYIAFKKIISEAPPNEVKADEKKPNFFSKFGKRIAAFFTLPRFEPIVLYVSMAMFLGGTIFVIIGQQKKEKIRNLGWSVKNYMVLKKYYSMPFSKVTTETGVTQSDLNEMVSQYPNEFVVLQDGSKNPTLIMVDSIPRRAIIQFSEKLLAAYLNNDAILMKNNVKPFDNLFQENDFFTYEVVNSLIVDSAYRYTFNLEAGKAGKYVIVKRK